MHASRSPRDKPKPPRDQSLSTDDEATGSVTHCIGDPKVGDQRAIRSFCEEIGQGRFPGLDDRDDESIGSEPSPEFVAMVAEKHRRRIETLESLHFG
jgi:hypothetical protein